MVVTDPIGFYILGKLHKGTGVDLVFFLSFKYLDGFMLFSDLDASNTATSGFRKLYLQLPSFNILRVESIDNKLILHPQ